MVDYGTAIVSRLRDKASPGDAKLIDVIRARFLLRGGKVSLGMGVRAKKGVQLDICETGKLVVDDHVLFHRDVWILMTMPQPVVHIGKWVMIGYGSIIAAKNRIDIGDFTVIGPRCYFIDHDHGFAPDDLITNQRSVIKSTHVGRDCYFGTGVVVTAGVTIGDGAVVGAGSVVTKDIGSNEVWAGNPAKFVRSR